MTKPTDAELLEWLEAGARASRTGVGLDWVPGVDGESGGYRFMRHGHVGHPHPTLRHALEEAYGWRP